MSARWICNLSWQEVRALELYGLAPIHSQHKHIARSKAIQLLKDDLAITIGEEAGLDAIVLHMSNGYVWKSRMSGGANVRQMVRVVQG